MTSLTDRRNAMLFGAVTADAASMGFHWLYDQDRIRAICPSQPEFHAPNPSDYDGVPGYYAHPNRTAGDLSHYGEQAMVMLRSLSDTGYTRAAYQSEFASYFGYGGAYVGYIDRPTRQTLDNIARMEDDDTGYPGADDTQLPALSKLPALVAAHHSAADFDAIVEDAVRVTNNNDKAVAYGVLIARLLRDVLQTGKLPDARGLIKGTPIEDVIAPALARLDETTEAVTKDIGLSCQLDFAVPSIFHNLSRPASFAEHIRTNIYTKDNNYNHTIILGTVLGALHGIGGGTGIPEAWIDRLAVKKAIKAANL